ncbi:MAG: response regulator [Clostridia bacterium]|nr:response regulator [Clostridia bacterium]
MRKRLFFVLVAIVLSVGLIMAGGWYYNFVSDTIFTESAAHLTEIYHQVNRTFNGMVGKNWSTMRMWSSYLKDTEDEASVKAFIENAREETGFTDFYFVSKEGEYKTIDGKIGYLDLKSSLPELVLEKKSVVVNSVVPGKPEIMVFAVPASSGTYMGFGYEAIAISFDNSDLVETLKISAFDGKSSSYVVHPDGRVILDNATGEIQDVYNFLGMLEERSELTSVEIEGLRREFLNGGSGVTVFSVSGTKYYLVYESMDFENWVVLGAVPASVVNESMNTLQFSSLLLVTSIAACVIIALIVIVVVRYRRSLTEKDKELLFREELFSVLSNNVDDVFAMLGAKNLRVNYISPNADRLVGIPAEAAQKDIRVVDRLVKNKSDGLILDKLPDILPGEQAEWDREYIHQKTGETRWFHVTALCRNIKSEKKYIIVLSDRTKEKKINKNLEDAVNLAKSANKAKSTFLSNMSHDIRTPMNAIIGFASLATANVDNPKKVEDYLAKILSSGTHLLSLINDVLDMSRIESGKIYLEEQEVNLSDVLHDIKTIIGGQINAKQLDLYMDTLDVTDEDVFCDRTRLNQVLLNLLSNAIKFTPSGGTVSVRVAQLPNAPTGKGVYEIRVKDTGIGMSSDFAEHIFEPFERERSSTVSQIQGTGLGMAISKNIVEMMGGTIEVNSEKGKGTEFVIRLTLRLRSQQKIDQRIEELEGLKALVADDDFNTCDSVTKMLTKVGMRPEWTLSGTEAVLGARQASELNDSFHAYIIDWRLPDMNGIEVTRQIRSMGDDTPIIILTAYDWTNIEDEAKEAGVTAFCSKPMFMSDLRESLLTAIGKQEIKKNKILPSEPEAEKLSGRRVLLAEDNELNREIAMEILGEYGMKIETAENGAIAVEKVAGSEPGYYDLVLMDIQMPVMDGSQATRKIRELENPKLSSIPIIAMTANAFDDDRKAAEECGMNGFLSKPINIEEVIQTLQRVLNIQ